AAGHPATAEAGAEVLRAGGSAADAAVAAILTACASETLMTGLGGGGFATYWSAAERRATCVDFFVTVPGLAGGEPPGPMRPVAVRFGNVPLEFSVGGATVAVPGVPAGCAELYRRWGRLPWADVVAPAVEHARTGTVLPHQHATALVALAEAMLLGAGKDAYQRDGELLRAGDTLLHPGLADTLSTLASRGAGLCYDGELADEMVA